jgi:hypothetical protein
MTESEVTTKSDEIQARKDRYLKIERVVDKLGRTLGLRRLKPTQKTKIKGMAPDLAGFDKITDEKTGNTVEIPRWGELLIVASVCEIDGTPIPFPKNRAELDAIHDRLDDEGLEAAGKVFLELYAKRTDEVDESLDPLDQAKN